jgi:hypothetical protein
MKKNLPIDAVSRNFMEFANGYGEAVQQVQQLVSQCRGSILLPILMEDHPEIRKLPIGLDAKLRFASKTDDVANKEALRRLEAMARFCDGERRLLANDPLGWRVIQAAPDAAHNKRLDQRKAGYNSALSQIRDVLSEVREDLCPEFFEDIFGRKKNPLRNGQIQVTAEIAAIQVRVEDIYYEAADFSCRHAIELVRALAEFKNPLVVVENFQCWEHLVNAGQQREAFKGKKSGAYSLASWFHSSAEVVNPESGPKHPPGRQPEGLGFRPPAHE